MAAEPMLLLWEDLNPGDEYWTPARTMTETDLVWFCSWTGDWLPIHSDEEFAKQSEFGTRIFHGQAGYAAATGLVSRSGLHNGAIVVLEATLKYKKPLRVGDTIRVRSRVTDKRPTKKLDRGIIFYDVAIVNQNDEVITEGPWTFLVRRKSES